MNYIDEVAHRIRTQLDRDVLPDVPYDGLLRSYAVLALAVGDAVTAEDVHDAWVAWMTGHDPAHPALKPLSELDDKTAEEDEPFVRAIQSVAREHQLGRPRGERRPQ